jgi:hypothetical protein
VALTTKTEEKHGGGGARHRWLWLLAGVLLAAVVLVAVVLPGLLDVERHRGRIEGALEQATGWDAELGEIDLSVLRGLVLTVSPASLAAPEGGSRFEVGKIAVRAAWMPLFRGRLEIRSVELVRPDMTLVRPDSERGWVLPLPPDGPRAEKTDGPAAVEPAAAVTVDRIDVRGGAVRLEDRSADPPRLLTIEEVDVELRPAEGEILGSGVLAGGGGRIRWSGSSEEALELTFENLTTDVLGPWVGDGVLHPGGRLDGTLTIAPSGGVTGTVSGESLRVLAGSRPLPATELAIGLSPDGAGWRVDRLELKAGGAVLVGTGTLLPLALKLEMPATPLETALELTEALFPLGLDVSPPGEARVQVRVDVDDGGELSYEADGELSAARFVAADILPEATDVRAAFKLTRQGKLVLTILDASVGGGPLEGEVRIDSIEPLGKLTFAGEVSGASLGTLLGGFIDRAPERLAGPAALSGNVVVDLGAPTLDAASIGGSLALGAADVSLAGWDLESAFRETLRAELGKLADVAALVDPDARKALEPDASGGAAPTSRLLERLAADVSFDRLPWDLSALELRSGGITARGRGSFDPVAGTVELVCDAELDDELTGRYVQRYPQLHSLVNERGHLSLPMRLDGPLMQPQVGLEVGRLVPGAEEPEEAVEELIKGLLDRKLSKKKR